MNNIRVNEIRVMARSIWTISIFGLATAFSGVMYGSTFRVDPTTPETLKDDPNPIIEDIIVRESRSISSTVIVTFEDENAAEESQRYFHFLSYKGDGSDDFLVRGGLLVSDEPSLSENQVLLFALNNDIVASTFVVYYNPSEPGYRIFRLSDWINREEELDHDNDAQDQGSDGGGTVPPS